MRESASALFATSALGASPAAKSSLDGLEIPVWDVDTDALDAFLRSDRAPPDSMFLPELDGFLTGIAIGPEIILPSEWLPIVWGGGQPIVTDAQEIQAVLGGMMSRFNQILQQIAEGTFAPLVWETPDGTVIANDWAQGFCTAMSLRPTAWKGLIAAKDRMLLVPILVLGLGQEARSPLGLDGETEEELLRDGPSMLPTCVMMIAEFWRKHRRRESGIRTDRARGGFRIAARAARNDPCPCGSGIKFKRCCGP